MKLRKKMMATIIAFTLSFSLLQAGSIWAQYNSVMKSPGASEQLRLGVQSYNRGRYAESILLFEKALAYAPGEALIEYWLGRSYLKSGFEETALRLWRPLLSAPDVPPFLKAKAEALRSARAIAPTTGKYHFVEVERFEGRKGKDTFFNRPSTIVPRPDGSLLVVAHGSNELVMLDSSGIARQRFQGGLSGFDRPFGAAYLLDGTLFVSEFNGDRISRIAPDGTSRVIGKKGRMPDGLLGPQYIATDTDGYLFVVDFGNARVSKFDDQGNFVLSFGGRSPDSSFPGLVSPTGIFVINGMVFVADSLARAIFKFDISGNYIGVLAAGELHFPEGISAWEGGRGILVADTDRIVSVDIETEVVSELYQATSKKARIVGASADYNGNLVVCDFDASVISILSDISSLASGYDVEIQSVDSSTFPRITFDVMVRNKDGSPLVGLREGNFYLTETVRRTSQADEGGKAIIHTEESIEPASDVAYLGSGDNAVGSRSILVLERSLEMSSLRDSQRSALAELYTKLPGMNRTGPSLVTADAMPALQPPGDLRAALRIALAPPSTGRGRFDLAVRLAATSLLPSGNRDSIVYLGTGAIDESSFSGTTLGELAALMRNNEIRFFAVVLGEPASSLRYLAERTGGEIFSASRPRGLSDLATRIVTGATGHYRFSFTSKAETSFGRGYLALSVEAFLYKKSGKDELGYYAPLK